MENNQGTETIITTGAEPVADVIDRPPEEMVEAYLPEGGETRKFPASALVGGSGQTIDEYLADTRDGKKRLLVSTGKLGIDKSKTVPPTELELEIRAELGGMNRKERRAFLAKQSRAIGKLRGEMLTLHAVKDANGVKSYVTRSAKVKSAA